MKSAQKQRSNSPRYHVRSSSSGRNGNRSSQQKSQSKEPYQLQPQNAMRVKLIPDVSTDKLRQVAVTKLQSSNAKSQSSLKRKTSELQAPAQQPEPKQNPKLATLLVQDENEAANNVDLVPTRQSFVRSQRSQKMIHGNEGSDEAKVKSLQDEKSALIRRLNESLLNLDKLNEEKRKLHDKLIEQMKFVRDLNKATGGDNLEDVTSYVSDELKQSYKNERKIHKNLQNELTKAEKERSKLLQRMKKISDQRQVKMSSSPIMRDEAIMSPNKVQYAGQLMQEIDILKDQIALIESEIAKQSLCKHHRFQRQDSDPEIVSQERSIGVLKYENQMLRQRTQEMQQKEQQLVRQFRKEIVPKQGKTKKISVLLLARFLSKMVAKSQQKVFQQLWVISDQIQLRKLKIGILRKVVHMIGLKQQRMCMQVWYSVAFEPEQTYSVMRQLPDFYRRKDLVDLEMNKYKIETCGEFSDKVRLKSALKTVSHITKNWQLRLLQSSFKFWDKSTHPKANAIKMIARAKARFNLNRKHVALSQWAFYTQDKRLTMRLGALPVLLSCQQMKLQVYKALVQNMYIKRVKHRSQLVRTFRTLKIAKQRQKLITQLGTLSRLLSKESQHSTVQACFSQLNLDKEAELVQQIKDEIQQIEPCIDNLKQEATHLSIVKRSQELKRAVKLLTVTIGSKFLAYWLHKWQKQSQAKTKHHDQVQRNLLLKVYKNKLGMAFSRMQIQESRAQQDQDHSQIDELHHQIQVRSTENEVVGKQVGTERKRIREMSIRHLRTLMIQAFMRNIEYWILKWKLGCALKRDRELAVRDVIIHKLRNGLLRQAFARYRIGHSLVMQDLYNQQKIREVESRLRIRTKKRVYQAIFEYSQLHIDRVRCYKYLVRMIERHNQLRGILVWKKFTRATRELCLFKDQQKQVANLDVLQEDLSTVSDKLNQRQINVNHLRKLIDLEARLTLSKWVERFGMGGLQYGFITWRQKAENLKKRAQFTQFLKVHLEKKYIRLAIQRWHEANQNMLKYHSNEYIEKVDRIIEQQMIKNNYNREQFDEFSSIIREKIQPILEETELWTAKLQRVIDLMIKRRIENFYSLKERHLIKKWREHNDRYQKGSYALQHGISRMMMQSGLDHIRNAARRHELFEKRQKVARKWVAGLYKRYRLRRFYSEWRGKCFEEKMWQQLVISRQEKKEIVEQKYLIKQVKIHHVTIFNENKATRFLSQLYNFWHEWAYRKHVQRQQTKALKQEWSCYLKRRALFKLHHRALIFQKQTTQIANFKQTQRKIYQWACFRNLKYFWQIYKKMAVATQTTVEALKLFQVQSAFSQIRSYAGVVHRNANKDKLMASKMIVHACAKIKKSKFSHAYLEIKAQANKIMRLTTIVKQDLIIGQVQKRRQYFYRWKQNTKMMEVVDVNEDQDGPRNLECWRLRLRCNILAEMMQKDGAPDELIQRKLVEERNRFKSLTDKTVTRLMINGDRDLQMLPYCLDKLRNHARVMKKWRYCLQHCNRLLNQDQDMLYSMFRKWKDSGDLQVRQLQGTPYQQLLKRSDLNLIQLLRNADSVDHHSQAIEQFTAQRNTLLKNFMSSQRLGFSLAKHNQHRTNQKTINKMSDFGQKKLQRQIGNTIDKNLKVIQQLKEIISTNEDRNHQLAMRNDSHRIEAHQAVRNRKIRQSIQSEIHSILQRQGESAAQQKKLIEDNYVLTQQLQQARNSAKYNLDHNNMLHHQKMMELDQLRREERESASRRQILSQSREMSSLSQSQQQPQSLMQTSHHQPPQITRTTERELSPPQIVSPVSARLRMQQQQNSRNANSNNGRSPLRVMGSKSQTPYSSAGQPSIPSHTITPNNAQFQNSQPPLSGTQGPAQQALNQDL